MSRITEPFKKIKWPMALSVLGSISVVAFLWFRLYFGVEVTDEAYWVAEPYLVTRGEVPVVDLWSQTPLTSLLIAPIIQLYLKINNGAAGIMLFMRQFAFLFRLIVTVFVFLLLKTRIPAKQALAYSVCMFSVSLLATSNLNYNILSMYLLWLAATMLFVATQASLPKATWLFYTAGVVMGLCAIAHIAYGISCFLFVVILFFYDKRSCGKVPLFAVYIVGGLSVALLITLVLCAMGGGPEALWTGVQNVLAYNYFKIPKITLLQQLSAVCSTVYLIFVLKLGIPILLAITLPLLLKKRLDSHKLKQIYYILLVLLTCLLIIWVLFRADRASSANYILLVLGILLPFYIILSGQSSKQWGRLFFFFGLPCLVQWIAVSVSAHGSILTRMYILSSLATLVVIFNGYALEKLFPIAQTKKRLRFSIHTIGALLTFCIVMGNSFSDYLFVYRDESIPNLTTKVETGVYCGLYTTAHRAQALVRFENTVQRLTNADETILFADLMPSAYLMTQAQPFTPTTWDPSMYRYGFQDDSHYQRYFAQQQGIPDKIIFVNSEEQVLSINDPDNAFARFVRDNYVQIYQDDVGLFGIILYEKV